MNKIKLRAIVGDTGISYLIRYQLPFWQLFFPKKLCCFCCCSFHNMNECNLNNAIAAIKGQKCLADMITWSHYRLLVSGHVI